MIRRFFLQTLALLSLGLAPLTQPALAQDAFSDLSSLSFIEGYWRGENNGLVFEETWSNAAGGVMTGMARGVRDDKLVVLEYIIIEITPNGPVMRFKHLQPDYSHWDGEEKPITLLMVRADEDDVMFSAIKDDSIVQRIRYFLRDDGRLQADVGLLREGVADKFTLMFERVAQP